MNPRTLLALTALIGIFSLSANAQAAAEAALANAHSSASTVKAGSVLGRALNQGSSQLAGRMQQLAPAQLQTRVSQPSEKLNAQATSGTLRAGTPTGSSLIVSVHGGEPACAPSSQSVQGQNAAASTTPICGSKASPKTKPQNQYKSAVTLSFPKP
ncbi:MAG TPA: hypothetical protein VGV15_11535 [Terriglobales bacterium]|nr:hypothetical protein [Terriglobales bacterium]